MVLCGSLGEAFGDHLLTARRRSRRCAGYPNSDPHVPRDGQFGAIRQLLDEGIIRHAGLSEVSVADVEAAARVFPVATVQNQYNLVERECEDVVGHFCRP